MQADNLSGTGSTKRYIQFQAGCKMVGDRKGIQPTPPLPNNKLQQMQWKRNHNRINTTLVLCIVVLCVIWEHLTSINENMQERNISLGKKITAGKYIFSSEEFATHYSWVISR